MCGSAISPTPEQIAQKLRFCGESALDRVFREDIAYALGYSLRTQEQFRMLKDVKLESVDGCIVVPVRTLKTSFRVFDTSACDDLPVDLYARGSGWVGL